MPILKYIPPITKITDNRNPEGNFYIATCDCCGTQFYPKRMNAMYCTRNCAMIKNRKDIAAGRKVRQYLRKGGITKKEEEVIAVDKPNGKKEKKFKSVPEIYQYLKERFDTRGDKDNIIDSLKSLEIGDSYDDYGKLVFTKKSPRIYIMTRN